MIDGKQTEKIFKLVKELYALYKEYNNKQFTYDYVIKLNRVPIPCTIDCTTYFEDNTIYLCINEVTPVSREVAAIVNYFGSPELAELIDTDDIKEFRILEKKVEKITSSIKKIDKVLEYIEIIDYFEDTQFETAWKRIYKDVGATPDCVRVNLSNSYNAVIVKGCDTIKVGCQDINISNVKEVVKEWDRINQG